MPIGLLFIIGGFIPLLIGAVILYSDFKESYRTGREKACWFLIIGGLASIVYGVVRLLS